MAQPLIDAPLALALTARVLGLWGALTALQWWADRAAWRDGGPLGWDLLRLTRSRLFASPALAALFAPLSLRLLIGLQLVASLGLLAVPVSPATPWLLGALLVATVALCLRSHADGADKMALVVTMGALLQTAQHPALVLAGQLWIAGQLTIAYVTSGAAKLRLRDWRDGTAVTRAMASYGSGHRLPHALLRHRPAALTFAWVLMVAETLFPFALFASPAVLGLVLCLFFLFHAATALFMGLNTYPLAFVAAYPTLFVVAGSLRNATGL